MAKILIVGCGALGYELAKQLADEGHDVTGLKRSPPKVNLENFKFFRADIGSTQDLENLGTDFEYIFFIVSADNRNESSYHDIYDKGINNVINKFGKNNLTALWFFVSSTSVYGQNQGEWVDEDSPTLPTKATSLEILKAEQKLVALDPRNVVVRFSGIYGPGREYLLRTAKQAAAIQKAPPYYTNRIHQSDCVRVLKFLLEQRLAGISLEQRYLASDDDPAPMWDVISWLAEQMDCKPPVTKPTEQNCDMNKRCRNDRLKTLGYRFLYPSYQSGYLDLIQHNK